MTKEQDLSNFAAFDLDDLLSEISSQNKNKKEVTAYLDRSFIDNMIKEYYIQSKISKPDFTINNQIDYTDYNFTGADFRGLSHNDLQLFNFTDCDITEAHLDRVGIDFFLEYLITGKLIAQGINFQDVYLGPIHKDDVELGLACYVYLNLSNLNLTGSNFRNADIDGVILENTNISGCDFTGAINLDPKQFAFSIGFETAIFSQNKDEDAKIKAKIQKYSESMDRAEVGTFTNPTYHKVVTYLANLTNVLDD